MLYDSLEAPDKNLIYAAIHRFVDLPLSYLGYIPEYWDVRQPLPQGPLVGRCAGIVSWLLSAHADNALELQQWLVRHVEQGLRVVFLGEFGFPPEERFLAPFLLDVDETVNEVNPPLTITTQSELVGFEIKPIPDRRAFLPLRLRQGTPLLQLQDAAGQRFDAIAFTPWGGYARDPYVVVQLPAEEQTRWIINPLEFFARALALPQIPVPDPTTENGRRLMFVHIDGDGFVSRAERTGTLLTAEVLLTDILQQYRVPTTVSLVQAETAPDGLYPELSVRAEELARQIFALPHVEIASHSYSHPFAWQELEKKKRGEKLNLEIPDYSFDVQKEVQGSIDYINRRLAPPGKHCQVFLWTGDCDPGVESVKQAYLAGVGNMNFGETRITRENPSLTSVAPLGLKKGEYFQVYAPSQNENVYTNLWSGPFYGYERALETFQLTESPHRFKPINIYFHFYSASKKASLAALHKVYRWALQQPVMNIYASEYIAKVLDFNRLQIAWDGEGWRVRGATHLRQLRMPKALGYPDFQRSQGVVGFQDREGDRYLHLDGSAENRVVLTDQVPTLPFLSAANARVTHWQWMSDRVQFGLQGYRSLQFQVVHAPACTVGVQGRALVGKQLGSGAVEYTTEEHAIRTFDIICP